MVPLEPICRPQIFFLIWFTLVTVSRIHESERYSRPLISYIKFCLCAYFCEEKIIIWLPKKSNSQKAGLVDNNLKGLHQFLHRKSFTCVILSNSTELVNRRFRGWDLKKKKIGGLVYLSCLLSW